MSKYRDVILFLGPKSQMKQQLLNNLSEFNLNCPIKLLDLYYGANHNVLLIKLQGLKLDQKSIQQSYINLNNILDLGFKYIKMIYYVVKFDRIDIMKNLIVPFLVKFRDYLSNITLIVTGMELSDKQNRNIEKEFILKELLQYFNLSQNNFIICKSCDDLSYEFTKRQRQISCSLDISKLGLLPMKVDQENLDSLKRMFLIDFKFCKNNNDESAQRTPIFPNKKKKLNNQEKQQQNKNIRVSQKNEYEEVKEQNQKQNKEQNKEQNMDEQQQNMKNLQQYNSQIRNNGR